MTTQAPSWLIDALPEGLRAEVRVEAQVEGQVEGKRAGGVALRLSFSGGRVIDVRLTREAARAYRVHGPLSFGYRVEGGDGEAARALCEELADRLAREVSASLVAYLEAQAEASAAGEGVAAIRVETPRASATMMLTEGDVLRGRRLAELARASEVESVELYLHGGVCVQRCQFCAYPRVRAQRGTLAAKLGAGLRVIGQRATGAAEVLDWLARVVEIMRERAGGRVILSGPDCLRHPQIDAMLELLAREDRLGVELLGPLTRLAEAKLAARVAAIPGLRGICTSLLSTQAEIHDAMVGTPGAHAQVMAALANCRAQGIAVTINVLVGPANVEDLPALLELCAELRVDNVNVTVYHPESAAEVLVHASWRELELAELVVARAALLRAWEAAPSHALERVHAHYLPRCWVPAELREALLRTALDLQDNFCHPPGCATCSERDACPGITVPALERLGPSAVEPIVDAGRRG